MPEFFPCHRVTEMNFNDWRLEHGNGISDGVRIMGEGGGIEDHWKFGIGRLMQPGDNFDL